MNQQDHLSEQEQRRKSFLELGRGAMLERFDYEMGKVVDNILDVNTPADKPRKISLTLTLRPDSTRQQIAYDVVVKPTLQPTNPISGSTAIMPDGNGVVSLVEMVPQVPGQMAVNGSEQRQPDIIQFPRQA